MTRNIQGTFFATFGGSSPFHRRYVGIVVKSAAIIPGLSQHARETMFKLFGKEWAFVYVAADDENGLARQQRDYGLTALAYVKVYLPGGWPEDYPVISEITEKQFTTAIIEEMQKVAA